MTQAARPGGRTRPGPERWNALGLGSTAVFAAPLVYNTKRSGALGLGGRRAFPPNPPPEWFVVDLFENADRAGASRTELAAALTRACARPREFTRERLREMAKRYGTKATQSARRSVISSPGRRTRPFGR
jgi:hypothetical protein